MRPASLRNRRAEEAVGLSAAGTGMGSGRGTAGAGAISQVHMACTCFAHEEYYSVLSVLIQLHMPRE